MVTLNGDTKIKENFFFFSQEAHTAEQKNKAAQAEVSHLKQQLDDLQAKSAQAESLQQRMTLLENENKKLYGDLAVMSSRPAATSHSSSNGPDSTKLDQLEKELQFQQSVIADQVAKLALLEKDRDKFKQMYEDIKTQVPAPASLPSYSASKKVPEERPYCSFCEVFGHTSEQCTNVSIDTGVPSPTRSKAAPLPDRDYCVLCESFGHIADNCPNMDEEF